MIGDIIESITFNPLVERSNRSRPTIHHKGFRANPFFTPIEKTLKSRQIDHKRRHFVVNSLTFLKKQSVFRWF